ncbi:uncharacterized protein LOC111378739, partial [Olea europaea var. sylvestris]|uniref:uncharacterized protein LOC111378739 n=1 Tax=Olea europaea var. sylvestris TaxID=158386 RepID=UPI000C1D5927
IMERFFQPKRKSIPNSSTSSCGSSPATDSSRAQELLNNTKKSRAQFNVDDLVSDPGIRPLSNHMILILEMLLGWHTWRRLEYSIEKDAAHCLHCYLFKLDRGGQGGGRIFTKTGFRDWKHKKTLKDHVACCKEIKEVLFSNAPGNDQMTSPTIQNDLINCWAVETTRAIINEIGDFLFSILVDEACDNSVKEQMAVVLRFVDKSGQVKERFLGISHFTDTCAQSLKDAIDAIFSTHGLSISSLRGQCYDGASNMSDALRINYQANILEKLNTGKLTGGSGQFQEMSLARP